MSNTQAPDMLIAMRRLVHRFRPHLESLTTPQQRFSCFRLPIPHLSAGYPTPFDWNVHHPDFLSEQLPVVWDPLL